MTCWKTRTTYQPKAKIHYYFCDFMALLSRRHIYFSENAAFQPAKRAFAKNMARGRHFKIPAPCLFLSMMLRRCSIGERNKGLWFDCSALCFSPFLAGVGVFGNITQKRFAACVGRSVKIAAQVGCVLERNFDLILRSAAFPDCHGAANQRGKVEKCQLRV